MGTARRRFHTTSQIECLPRFQGSHGNGCVRPTVQFGIGNTTMDVHVNKSVRAPYLNRNAGDELKGGLTAAKNEDDELLDGEV